jgi:hypothetical protein
MASAVQQRAVRPFVVFEGAARLFHMNKWIQLLRVCALLMVICGCALTSHREPVITPNFLSVAATSQVLGAADAFAQAMSPFDRSLRLRRSEVVDAKTYLAYAAEQALPWSAEEKQIVTQVFNNLAQDLARRDVPLSGAIDVIKTTGEEEGHAAYVRGGAIVLPATMLQKDAAGLRPVLAHEFFHVLMHRVPSLRNKLYPLVGFEACDEPMLPEAFARRKITNPDVVANTWCMPVTLDGASRAVYPMLFSPQDRFIAASGATLLDYAVLRLLVAEKRDGRWVPRMNGSEIELIDPVEVPEFFDKIGYNTAYILHPEEVLAENFVLWLAGVDGLRSQHIIDGMDDVFAN